MSKKVQLIAFLIFSLWNLDNLQAQVYEKGDFTADIYYGRVDGMGAILKAAADRAENNEFVGLNYSYTGNIGGRFEYLLGERIGLGLNVNYANTTIKGNYIEDDGNSYSYQLALPRLRIFPALTIHMGNSDKWDPYFLFGLGYSNFRSKVTTNAPNIPDYSFTIPFYFASRVEFGVKYFFTDHLGVHAQVGFPGAGLVAIGLSGKF